ncbi:hypothetical protein C8Q74DRAFT_1220971 [Fomes fomentarius]|nr:hypothetical protein C8Q74DRAFT_1220971 [Fomes fomentarius]
MYPFLPPSTPVGAAGYCPGDGRGSPATFNGVRIDENFVRMFKEVVSTPDVIADVQWRTSLEHPSDIGPVTVADHGSPWSSAATTPLSDGTGPSTRPSSATRDSASPKIKPSQTRRPRERLPTMAEMWEGPHFPNVDGKHGAVYKRKKLQLIDDPSLDPHDLPLRCVEAVYRCLLQTCSYKGEWAQPLNGEYWYSTAKRCTGSKKRDNVKEHVWGQHLDYRPYICPYMCQGFTRKRDLRNHFMSFHTHLGSARQYGRSQSAVESNSTSEDVEESDSDDTHNLE